MIALKDYRFRSIPSRRGTNGSTSCCTAGVMPLRVASTAGVIFDDKGEGLPAVSRGTMQIIGGFWVYTGILEYLQHFSPGRHPSIADFGASALGALCGGLAMALLWRRPPVSPP